MTNTPSLEGTDVKGGAESRRFASFAVSGGIAAICNLGSRMLLSKVMRYEMAITIAYLIGMIVAFLLARRFVFEASRQPWRGELARFVSVNLSPARSPDIRWISGLTVTIVSANRFSAL